MVNALAAADRIIIPVQTEFLALKGLDRMVKTMEIMQGEQELPFKYTIVPTMFDKRTKASIIAFKKLQEIYVYKIWPGVVPIDTNLRNASIAQKVPSDFAANSRGTLAYKSLLHYLLTQQRQGNEAGS
jgi:chromosome partitioning protein